MAAPAPAPASRPARPNALIWLALSALVIVLDQLTQYRVLTALPESTRTSCVRPVVSLALPPTNVSSTTTTKPITASLSDSRARSHNRRRPGSSTRLGKAAAPRRGAARRTHRLGGTARFDYRDEALDEPNYFAARDANLVQSAQNSQRNRQHHQRRRRNRLGHRHDAKQRVDMHCLVAFSIGPTEGARGCAARRGWSSPRHC